MPFKNKDVRGIAAQIAPEDGDEVWLQGIDQREHYHAGQTTGEKHVDAYHAWNDNGAIHIEKYHSDDN